MEKDIKLFMEHDGKQYDMDSIVWGERAGPVTPEEKHALESLTDTIVNMFLTGELTEQDVKEAKEKAKEEEEKLNQLLKNIRQRKKHGAVKNIMTGKELAKYIGVDEKTVHFLVNNGILKPIHAFAFMRFCSHSVKQALEKE